MAEFPALPLWTDAYLGDTTHLTTFEHGAYLLLLIVAWWSKDTRLPDDDKLLARYARCSAPQWKKLRPILAPFFTVKDGFWVQGRLTDESVAVRTKKEAAAANGRASALKRQGRHSTKREQSVNGASTERQRDFNLTNNQNHIQLDKSNCADDAEPAPDPDKQFWDMAKGYLGASKSSLIGQWVRDHGKEATASAIAAAQVERAVDPVQFIVGRFRHQAKVEAGASERPIC